MAWGLTTKYRLRRHSRPPPPPPPPQIYSELLLVNVRLTAEHMLNEAERQKREQYNWVHPWLVKTFGH